MQWKFASEKGAFSQEYFVYCKKTQRMDGANFPQDVDGIFDQWFPKIIWKKLDTMQPFDAEKQLFVENRKRWTEMCQKDYKLPDEPDVTVAEKGKVDLHLILPFPGF